MRRLAQSLVSLSLLVPGAAFPLGLGDIHLHSALGQPLRAEIDLLSVKPSELPGLSASLASYNTFRRAGVDRPADLMYLNFTVERRRNGKYEIKVTSKRPINEPFLDFLVNVSWNSGRLVREYTLLLDPPDMAKKEAPPTVTAPTTPARSTRAAAPVSPPVSPAPAAGSTTSSGAAAGNGTGGLKYGPVKSDDTLWSIAWRLRPNPSVSVQQVMMALFKDNPNAFIHHNVNGIKTGYVLRVDDPAQITAMSRAQALRAVREQARQWQDYKSRTAAKAKTRRQQPGGAAPAVSTAVAAPKNQLKLLAPEQKKRGGSGNAAAAGGKAAGEQAKSAGGEAKKGLAPLRHDVALALETAEAQRRANETLRKRLNDLEGQMATMQRLLTLKTNQLAALQSQGQPQQAPAAAGSTAQPAAAAAAKKPAPAPAAKKPAPSPAPKAAPVVKHAPKPVPRPAPRSPSLLEGLLDSPVVLGGLAIVALGLLALIWLAMRRRRSVDTFQESILTGGSDSLLKPRGGAGPASEESSLFSDLTVSGMQDIHADDGEVDPLTEAKVYMAYGRYQQAEELLKGVLAGNPKQPEVMVKLLELYRDTNNREAFEKRAPEAFSLLDGSGPLWDKVAAMGRGLAPENPLFSTAETAEAVPPNEPPSDVFTDNEVLDIGLDLDALAEDMESSAEDGLAGGAEFDPMLDLSGLDGLDEMADRSTADAPAADAASPAADGGDEQMQEAPELVSFDLGAEEMPADDETVAATPAEAPEEVLAAGPETADGEAAAEAVEAAAAEAEAETPAEGSPAATEGEADGGMEFDLGDFRIGEAEGEDDADAYHDDEHLLDFAAAPAAGTATSEGGDEEPAAAIADDAAPMAAETATADTPAESGAMPPIDEAVQDLEQEWRRLSEDGATGEGEPESGADAVQDEAPTEVETGAAADEAPAAEGVEFDLGDFQLGEEEGPTASGDYHDDEHLLDFGALAETSEEGTATDAEAEPAVVEETLPVDEAADAGAVSGGDSAAAIDDVDLESELESFKTEAPAADPETSLVDEALELDLAAAPAADEGGAGPSLEQDGSEEDLNLENLFDELEAQAQGSDEDESLDIDDSDLFGEIDETGTKLDLARAYIDMGDNEGAQVLLDEVMKEGNEEQRQQAEALRKQVP